MKTTITVNELKTGDVFIYGNDIHIYIVHELRIIEEMELVYILLNYISKDGVVRRYAEVFENEYTVTKISI